MYKKMKEKQMQVALSLYFGFVRGKNFGIVKKVLVKGSFHGREVKVVLRSPLESIFTKTLSG